MARQGDVGAALVVREDVVEKALESRFLGRIALALVGRPERVGLGESGLEQVAGVGAVDVRFAAATVACMDADGFAEKLVHTQISHREKMGLGGAYLFHLGDEWTAAWELQAGKGQIRRCQASIQGTGVVRLGSRNLLGCDLIRPEGIGLLGLLDAFRRDVGI